MATRRKSAPEIDATDALKSLDEAFLECRDLRHPWVNAGYFRDNGHVCRRLECPRCEMIRVDRWFSNGARDLPRYYAPEGYYLAGSHASAQDVRVEVLRRARGSIARSERALFGEG